MTKIVIQDLPKILASHAMWARGEDGGNRSDLSRADLIGADLIGADLSGANLSGAKGITDDSQSNVTRNAT